MLRFLRDFPKDVADAYRWIRWRWPQREFGWGTLMQDFVFSDKRDGTHRFSEPYTGGYSGEVPLERFGRFGMLIWIGVFPGTALVALFLIGRSLWHWLA